MHDYSLELNPLSLSKIRHNMKMSDIMLKSIGLYIMSKVSKSFHVQIGRNCDSIPALFDIHKSMVLPFPVMFSFAESSLSVTCPKMRTVRTPTWPCCPTGTWTRPSCRPQTPVSASKWTSAPSRKVSARFLSVSVWIY